MRKQIAAANWKMNGNYQQAESLLNNVLQARIQLKENQEVIFAVPFPFLIMSKSIIANEKNYYIAAQNVHHKVSGAYTGEVSGEMLKTAGIKYVIVGHSERREYFNETNAQLAEKVDICFKYDITPLFCCGEPLSVREADGQNAHVEAQISESLFHLSSEQFSRLVIAYEPIWAIGTGKTASTAQAQEIQQFIRSVIEKKYGVDVSASVPILYGGSVKAANAGELFACADVDGGLVGGASLVAEEFVQIIKALKK